MKGSIVRGAVLVVLAAPILTLNLLVAPAGALAPTSQGWWTSLNLGNGLAPPSGDVPTNGLLVESEMNGQPTAFSALVYQLPDGAVPSTLTLAIAPSSATTPSAKLEICPLKSPVITTDAGGPMSDAPAYDCTHNVSTTPESDGSGYRFNVAGMESNGSLAIAILPTSQTDRVVFSQPQATSLSMMQPGSSTPTSTAPTLPGASTVTTFPDASSANAFGSLPDVSAGTIPGFTQTVPSTTPTATPTPSGAAAAGPRAPSFHSFESLATVPDTASPWVVMLILTGLVGGASLWAYAGRRRPEEEIA